MSKHTPGPWATLEMSGDVEIVRGPVKRESRGCATYKASIGRLDDLNGITTRRADATRIVVCVNAMEGLSNAEVKALRKAHSDAIKALEQIAALECLPIGDQQEEMSSRMQAARIARAALAKAGGQEYDRQVLAL